jgi:hypothetical protein
VEFFGGYELRVVDATCLASSTSVERSGNDENHANPRIGSGMQQARALCVEKAVEEVRNLEDGTSRPVASVCRECASVRSWSGHTE